MERQALVEGAHSSVLLFLRHAKELRAPWELRTLAARGHWDQVMPAFRRALTGVRGQVAAMPRLAAAWLSVLASIQQVSRSANKFACAACRWSLTGVPVWPEFGRWAQLPVGWHVWWDLGLAHSQCGCHFWQHSGCCYGPSAVPAGELSPWNLPCLSWAPLMRDSWSTVAL